MTDLFYSIDNRYKGSYNVTIQGGIMTWKNRTIATV